jgi:hypothetical protein
MNLQGMAQSLLSTKGMVDDEDTYVWTEAMVDALLFDTLREAAKDGKDPREYCTHLMQMIQERADEWLNCVA